MTRFCLPYKFDKNNYNIFTSLVSEFTGKRKETDGQKPSEVPPTEYLQLFYAIVKLVSQNTQIRVIRALRTVRGQTFTVVPMLQFQMVSRWFYSVGIDLYRYIVDSGLPLPFASKPRPQVSWYLESQIIHASTEVRETQGPGGETNVVTISNVTVKALTRRHHHAKLSCRANNTQLASPPTTTVVIELNNITKIFSDLKVLKIKNIVKKDLTRMVAHRHSRDSSDKKLTHQTNKFKLNRRKLPASSWRSVKQDSLELLINQYPEQGAKTNDCYSQLQDGVSLQFTPTVEDEGKFLVCRAENPKLPDASIEDRWKLKVHCKYRSNDG
ncbi:hypothetical protein ALC53_09589 [Atta colombica]|uniref:CD80-like immunoglobulin C2-set domain-containing protein n=1 Tax=Atta colombica TaxID=520822 RepID=A0A195B6B9_9HYME|nr:hypothetical protein ALC53_09589 [Atta colombica]